MKLAVLLDLVCQLLLISKIFNAEWRHLSRKEATEYFRLLKWTTATLLATKQPFEHVFCENLQRSR